MRKIIRRKARTYLVLRMETLYVFIHLNNNIRSQKIILKKNMCQILKKNIFST
jgi:hypothetical protein